jgi:hypothetical protein
MAADVTVPQMIDSFKNDPLDFAPGADAHYNNSGYFLLGAIIEKASGLPYAKFVEQRIFVPLGMTHTAYQGYERSPGPRAVGYSGGQAGYVPALPISMTQPYAAAALVSTVDDLARWDAAVSSGKLLTAADWKRAFTPYRLSTGKVTIYGYGWRIGQLQGTPMLWHPGAINGFHTFSLRLPQQKVYVAVLSNAESGLVDPGMLAQKAAAIAIGKPFPEYKEIALDNATLDAYAGVYQIDQAGKSVFRRVKDQLVMQPSGRRPVPLSAISQTAFLVPRTLDRFEFKRNAKGEVTELVSYHGDEVTVNRRLGPAPPPRQAVPMSNAAFDAHAGRYEFAPNVSLQLSRDGDRFFAQRTGQQKLQIFALSDNAFFCDEVDAEIRFEPATAQSPAGVVLNQGGRELQGKKID